VVLVPITFPGAFGPVPVPGVGAGVIVALVPLVLEAGVVVALVLDGALVLEAEVEAAEEDV